MEIGWMACIVYGFVSGLTEILPVSADASRLVVSQVIKTDFSSLLVRLFSHAGILVALIVCLREHIGKLYADFRLSRIPVRRRKRTPDRKSMAEIVFISSGLIPLLSPVFLRSWIPVWNNRLEIVAALQVLNGMILYLPTRVARGNKDSVGMSRLDGFFTGLMGAFGLLPGVSRVGCCLSYTSMRGADAKHALNWVMLLEALTLVCMIGVDGVTLFSSGVGFGGILQLIPAFLMGMGAFGGGCCAVMLMRAMALRNGYSGFSYYCWGTAFFLFIVYLTIG